MAGVQVRLSNPPVATTTDSDGNFAFTSVPVGTTQLEPAYSAPPAPPAVTAGDAVAILQHLVGLRPLDGLEFVAADVNASSQVTAADAALILQYVVGAINAFPAATNCGSQWIFVPQPAPVANQQIIAPQPFASPCIGGAIVYQPLSQAAVGQDFAGVLIGDVNGSAQSGAALEAPRLVTIQHGSVRVVRKGDRRVLRIPYTIQAPISFTAFDVRFRYDPKSIRSLRARFVKSSDGAQLFAQHAREGRLRVAFASAQPLSSPITLWIEARSASASLTRRALRVESIQAE